MTRQGEKVTLTDDELDALHNAGLNLRAFPAGTIGRSHREDVQHAIERIIASRLSSVHQTVEGVGTGAGGGDDPASTEATSRANRSVGCPEDPAQAHPLSDAEVSALMRLLAPVVEHRRHYGLNTEDAEVYARTVLDAGYRLVPSRIPSVPTEGGDRD